MQKVTSTRATRCHTRPHVERHTIHTCHTPRRGVAGVEPQTWQDQTNTQFFYEKTGAQTRHRKSQISAS